MGIPTATGFVTANTLSANRYLYVNNNPYTFYDPDGEYFLIAVDIISISLGVSSAIKNFSEGNIREGLYDVAGVAVDGVGLLAPVPAGVGMMRHAARHADNAVDTGRTLARACSFAAGTPVHTPNGLAAIEDLVYGDQLLAKSEATGNLDYKHLLDAYNHYHTDGLKLVVGYDATNTETIIATGEHPFYVMGQGFTRADELLVGQHIATHTSDTVEVFEVDLSPIELVAYNYTVEDYETYFVGEFGLWVHNSCDNLRYIPDQPLSKQRVNGQDIPLPLREAEGRPHTVLGSRVGSDGKVYRQSAEFPGATWPKANGNDVPLSEVHWTNHARGDHSSPHQHPFVYDGSGWQRQGGNGIPFVQ